MRSVIAVHVDIETDERLENTALVKDLDVSRRNGDATDARIGRQRVGGMFGGCESYTCRRDSLIARQPIRNFDYQRFAESALDGRFAELQCGGRGRAEQDQADGISDENASRAKRSIEALHGTARRQLKRGIVEGGWCRDGHRSIGLKLGLAQAYVFAGRGTATRIKTSIFRGYSPQWRRGDSRMKAGGPGHFPRSSSSP